jgi:hypothetical protein
MSSDGKSASRFRDAVLQSTSPARYLGEFCSTSQAIFYVLIVLSRCRLDICAARHKNEACRCDAALAEHVVSSHDFMTI